MVAVIGDAGSYDAGMPAGTAAQALALARRAAAAATSLTGTTFHVDELAVAAHLLLPLVVGDPVAPAEPRPAPGGGAVHADLVAEDEALFQVLATGAPGADAEQLAALCQECRLPVTPYRAAPSRPAPAAPHGGAHGVEPGRRLRPGDVTVIDMTAMWAGPLCTLLLAEWGAAVTTVEPPARPDGLRASPAQFAVLDRGKRRVPWDLRRAAERAAFEASVASADVLVESFSDRVLPNLGYPPDVLWQLNPTLTIVRLRAFPPTGPEASWVAYGRGVHAATGLGLIDGAPQPSLLAYPDPLAGLQAFGAILEALGRAAGGAVVDVSLAGAVAPLLAVAGSPLGAVDDAAIAELRSRCGGRPGPLLRRG